MKKWLLGLVLCASLRGQTTIACTAAGYCGNSLTDSGTSSGNNNIVTGLPFSMNATYNISDIKMKIGPTSTGTVLVQLVVDTNTSGATIATGTVLCSQTIVNPTASAVATFSLSGCGTLVTGKRYWAFANNNNASLQYTTDAGGTQAFFKASTCCTPQTTITGVVAGDAVYTMGIDITSAVTSNFPSEGQQQNDPNMGVVNIWRSLGILTYRKRIDYVRDLILRRPARLARKWLEAERGRALLAEMLDGAPGPFLERIVLTQLEHA